jgi:hypothetical protein
LKTKRRFNKRGSILLNVMVMSVVVAYISAAILRMALLRYKLNSRAIYITQEKRADTGALSALTGAWAVNGLCSSVLPIYDCHGWTAGTCGCTCSPSGPPYASVRTQGTASACNIFIGETNDLMPSGPYTQ